MSARWNPERRKTVPYAEWPAPDRLRWDQAQQAQRGPFRRPGPRRTRAPISWKELEVRYGRWLKFLVNTGALDPEAQPLDRLTPERLDAYWVALEADGNGDRTIFGRFIGLQQAIAAMHPGEDVRWISRPGSVPLVKLLDLSPRPVFVPDAAELLQLALDLFRDGMADPRPLQRQVAVRDAAMIAVLATRAPRRRALAGLRLGLHLSRGDDGWRLLRTPDLEKTRIELEMPLPPEVTPLLDHYVAVERRELLAGKSSDHVWIAHGGDPIAAHTIYLVVRDRVLPVFKAAFGPHRCRTAVVTFLAHHCPDDPLAGSLILGHTTAKMALATYNRAKGIAASKRYYELLARLCDG
jgi:integrase